MLLLTVSVGLAVHLLGTLPLAYWAVVRRNPFPYLRAMSPALALAFACDSSAGTLPVTLDCVRRSRQVSELVANFVLPLGATMNMDGAAIYFTATTVFLAEVSGNAHLLTPGAFLTLAFAATLGAMGSSPIPTPGLVVSLMVWQATFPGAAVPAQIAYLTTIDWIADRLCTAVNVAGDTMAARMVQQIHDRCCRRVAERDGRCAGQLGRGGGIRSRRTRSGLTPLLPPPIPPCVKVHVD